MFHIKKKSKRDEGHMHSLRRHPYHNHDTTTPIKQDSPGIYIRSVLLSLDVMQHASWPVGSRESSVGQATKEMKSEIHTS
jgi:hypothetical protein